MDDASIVAALSCLRLETVTAPQLTARQLRNKRYYRRLDVSLTEWHGLRQRVFKRDGYRCVYCGRDVSANPQCDHVEPLVLGGSSDIANLATSCKRCNSSKSGLSLEDWKELRR